MGLPRMPPRGPWTLPPRELPPSSAAAARTSSACEVRCSRRDRRARRLDARLDESAARSAGSVGKAKGDGQKMAPRRGRSPAGTDPASSEEVPDPEPMEGIEERRGMRGGGRGDHGADHGADHEVVDGSDSAAEARAAEGDRRAQKPDRVLLGRSNVGRSWRLDLLGSKGSTASLGTDGGRRSVRGKGDMRRVPNPAEHDPLPTASPAISHRREPSGASPAKLDLTDGCSSSCAELSRAEDADACQRRLKRALAGAVSLRSRGLGVAHRFLRASRIADRVGSIEAASRAEPLEPRPGLRREERAVQPIARALLAPLLLLLGLAPPPQLAMVVGGREALGLTLDEHAALYRVEAHGAGLGLDSGGSWYTSL
eukprot:scaffold106635_cov68-Phaeocystis_antarctica.AAC.8